MTEHEQRFYGFDIPEDGPVRNFANEASSASFHYADDSTKEWNQASACVDRAIRIYQNNPEHREMMEKIGNRQLWASEFKREIGLIKEREKWVK